MREAARFAVDGETRKIPADAGFFLQIGSKERLRTFVQLSPAGGVALQIRLRPVCHLP